MPMLLSCCPPLLELSRWTWSVANRLAAYALLNLLDDPALLAMAFC